ncbi:DMT family transporter [Mesorhizobium sp. BAC0120]|uniref:DMT family transporter n=1 Tax=Mesorhizobium sp. BAC0120 TaxID=3090670 RepID=UPI00298CD856|nr:DMT family transporter [Mesorhizobium sp. BAC0120]MDW6023026.1 DMT family transporter [Mesorhizobium sp. BAC0120]
MSESTELSGSPRIGIAAVCAAMALFAANDAVLKLLSEQIPPAQVMVLRGIVGGVLLLGLVLVTGAGPRLGSGFRPAVLLRTLCDALASVMFVMALMGLPVATVTALIQLVPVVTSIAGVLIFRDRMTRRQLAAVVLGLAGVLVITRPSGSVGAHLLFGIAAVALLAGRDVLTRCTAPGTPSLVVATMTTFAVPMLSIPEVAFQAWQPLEVKAAMLIGLISLLVAVGNLLMVIAVRYSPLPAIAPYRYTAILFALFAGLLLLDEQPDTWMIAGGGAIAMSGFLGLPQVRPPFLLSAKRS